MFSDVVLNVDKDLFENILEAHKKKKKVVHDIELNESALKSLVLEYKKLVKTKTKKAFPQDPLDQLDKAIDAVFLSWNNKRAIFYRKKYDIPDDLSLIHI